MGEHKVLRVEHEPFTLSTCSIQRVADDGYAESMLACTCQPQLVRPPRMRSKAHPCHRTRCSVWRMVVFHINNAPFSHCFLSINSVPNLMRTMVNIEAKEQLHLTMLRNSFLCKHTVQQRNIFFLYFTSFELFAQGAMCRFGKCKHEDAARLHVKAMH